MSLRRGLNAPDFYWDRSEEAFTVAEQLKDPQARTMMTNIGRTYARLAVHAEQQAALEKTLGTQFSRDENIQQLDRLLNTAERK